MQPDYAYDAMGPTASTAGLLGAFGFMQFIYWIWIIALLVGMWKMFVKAGKPGWGSLIPIYNTIIMLQIVQKPIWWFVLLFIPLVNIVVAVILMIELGKAFGKGAGWSIVFLMLLGGVGTLILGFGDSKYQYATAKPATPSEPANNSGPPVV